MAIVRSSIETGPAGGNPDEVPLAFRQLFRRHNREVATVSVFAFGLAAAGWCALLAFVYWASAMSRTFMGKGEMRSHSLLVWFPLGAMIALIATDIVERIHPQAERMSRKFFRFFTLIEAFLFVPQLTLTALQNLRAFVFLRTREMRIAWQIAKMVAAEKALPLHTLSARFIDQAGTQRALAALQGLGILKLQPEGTEWLLSMPNATARKICQQRVCLHV